MAQQVTAEAETVKLGSFFK